MPSSAVYDNVCKLLPWGYEQHVSCLYLTN